MNRKKISTVLLITLLVSLVIFFGCKKKETTETAGQSSEQSLTPQAVPSSAIPAGRAGTTQLYSVGTVPKTMIEQAINGSGLLYLSVQNNIINKLPHDNTENYAALGYHDMPRLKYLRLWKIGNTSGIAGDKLLDIITRMGDKYPDWTSLNIVSSNPTQPYRIKGDPPGTVLMRLVAPDPNPHEVSFNNWGEIDEIEFFEPDTLGSQ